MILQIAYAVGAIVCVAAVAIELWRERRNFIKALYDIFSL